MTKIEAGYTDYLKETNKMLGLSGLLLASADARGNPNAMTIGWGMVGIIWGKPGFIVMVRPSRYTYGLIEMTGDFTVNVPTLELTNEVAYFGAVSGRDHDKFKEKGLTVISGKTVKSPIVKECAIHYECKVVHKNNVIPNELVEEIHKRSYSQGDFHRIYFGEILAVYADTDVKKR